MLALVFSVLVTSYVIIPEAIFRFFFGFHISARSFVLTRSETAYRAVLVAFFPFWIAMGLTWYAPITNSWPFSVQPNSVQQRRVDYKTVATGLFSDAEFSKSGASFWPAFTRCARRQARLAFWYFFLIAVEAWLTGKFAAGYARHGDNEFYKWLTDRFVAPYISQWLPLLENELEVQADILSADGTLYQGIVSDYFLKDGGELSGIILQGPRRFNRDLYVKDKREGKNPEKQTYWTEIPSQHLYFFAEKILNMNLTYVRTYDEPPSVTAAEEFLAREFSQLTERIGKLRVSVIKREAPTVPSKENEDSKADN